MSKLQEWVDNATDQEIAAAMIDANHRQVSSLWKGLINDPERAIRLHKHYPKFPQALIGWAQSEEFKVYQDHESMMPEHAKADFVPAATTPEIGSLHGGNALVIDNEDTTFPTCLKNGEIVPILNYDLLQYQWVPTALEAKESSQYDFDLYALNGYVLDQERKKLDQERKNRIEVLRK